MSDAVGTPTCFGHLYLENWRNFAKAEVKLARLRRIGDALRVAVPQLGDLELWRDTRGAPHLRGKYEHWRPPGAWQTEEQFSDGTLRLAGLLWAVLDGKGPLLLEGGLSLAEAVMPRTGPKDVRQLAQFGD